jgi:hypothetical protein
MFHELNSDLVLTIIHYFTPSSYVLRDDIQEHHINRRHFSANKYGVTLILNDYRYTDGTLLSRNPHPDAVHYILQHHDLIDWYMLSMNPNDQAVSYLLSHPDLIQWWYFCQNTNDRAVDYLLQPEHASRLIWSSLVRNTHSTIVDYVLDHITHIHHIPCDHPHPKIIQYIITHPKEIHWRSLLCNPNHDAVTFVFTYWETHHITYRDQDTDYVIDPSRIDWTMISRNPHDRMVSLLLRYPQYINGYDFAQNTNERAVTYAIAHYQEIKLDRHVFSQNPSIFIAHVNHDMIKEWQNELNMTL